MVSFLSLISILCSILYPHRFCKFGRIYFHCLLLCYRVCYCVSLFLLQSSLVISSSITLCFHVAFCWLLVFKFGFGNLGAAFFIGTSYWLNVILLVLYMKFSIECKKTWVPISTELFHGIGEFFRCAIPSAGMIWWVSSSYVWSFTLFFYNVLFYLWRCGMWRNLECSILFV